MNVRSVAFLLLLALLGCETQSAPKATVAPVGSAKVIAPDRIFFKNMKASKYSVQDDHDNYRTTYTHKKLSEATENWQLKLVDDWINDRAWLSFQAPNPGLFYRLGAEGEEMSLLDYKQFTDIAAIGAFGQRLAAPYEICFRELQSQTASCLAAESPIRLALRETISDYLRLTDQD